MSGFAGLLDRAGSPVEPATLARMADRLAYRAPDGMRRWHAGRVGIVHGRLWTTPEEVGEEQPVGDPRGDLWLAADARIDNREELLTRLERRLPGLSDDLSDARLILAAYRALGAGLCDELVGDFAFALWDGSARQLVLARDALGVRQLYYAEHGSTVIFGSTIGAVLAALPERPPLNRELIEAFLHNSYRHWLGETIHRGILRLPPGHLLIADAAGLRRRRWWRPGASFAGAFSSDEEWTDGFRELFDQAVRCRLRATGPVAVLAGGGVDSAAVACVAGAALEPAARRRLRLVGLTFDGIPTADESEYLDELESWLGGIESRRIPAARLPASLGARPGDDQPLDEPEVYLLRSHTAALFSGAAASGCRVVLAGEGANQVLGHAFYYDPGALALVPWRELAAELPHFRAASGMDSSALLARALLWPLVPAPLKEALRRLRPGTGRGWVRPAGRGSWRRRLPPLAPPSGAAELSRDGRWAAQSLARPFDLARYAAIDVTAAHAGVEWRLPFLDRRLVDLLLHLPRRLRSRRGEDRRALRQAMIGRMPERIRRRRSKSHTLEVLDELLRHHQREAVERLLDNCRAEGVDCVTASITEAFGTYWSGSGDAVGLLSFLSLESWLRGVEEGD